MSWPRQRCYNILLESVNLGKNCRTKWTRRNKTIFSGEFSNVEKAKDNVVQHGSKTKILYINAGHNKDSVVCLAANKLFTQLTNPYELEQVDLWKGLPKYDVTHAMAKLRILQNTGTPDDMEKFGPMLKMAEKINEMDMLVISTPMWNYSIPYMLKHYIDIVVQPGINFTEQHGGPPCAVRPGRPLVLFSSSGGDGDPERDFLSSYLKVIFGLVGFDKFHHVNMRGMANGTRDDIMNEKGPEIQRIAQILMA